MNYPTIPLPLDGQTERHMRILDQQIALGYTHLSAPTGFWMCGWDFADQGGQVQPVDRQNERSPIPGLPYVPERRGRPAGGRHHGGFTAFGRQTTNPQFQNPALLDPKVNFTWVQGQALAQVRV